MIRSALLKLSRCHLVPPPCRRFSFGAPGLETDHVEHTPLFCQEFLQHLKNIRDENSSSARPLRVLDMTFGSGGHSNLILEQCESDEVEVEVVASDCDLGSYLAAQELSERFDADQLIPVRAKFSDLPNALTEMGIGESKFRTFLIFLLLM